MSSLTPMAIVIDRATAERTPKAIARCMSDLGGAWPEMYGLWRESSAPYLVMVAHTPERLRQRAPLSCVVADADALRRTLRFCCTELDGSACRWLLLVGKGGEAERITQAELLLDATPEGHA